MSQIETSSVILFLLDPAFPFYYIHPLLYFPRFFFFLSADYNNPI